jgi:NAD-dependent deacetylase
VASPVSDAEVLAGALARAARPVILTGRNLGAAEDAEPTQGGGEWGRRASLEAFLTEPASFWEYVYPVAERLRARTPNAGHHALARLERAGGLAGLITQGVDRLHQRAGSLDVVEVYGTLLIARCERCGERYGMPEVGSLWAGAADGVPRCGNPGCGYPLRPEGTLWEEPLPTAAVERAWELAAAADLFLIVDSDLRTAPISLLPSVPLTREVPLYLIGTVATQYDRYAARVVRAPSVPLLVALADAVAPEPG